MTLIEALLTLPEHGESKIVSREVAVVLAGASTKIVRSRGSLTWFLTDGGRRLLVQFNNENPDVETHVVVRLVMEDAMPVFHILCDGRLLSTVHKNSLTSSLQELQATYPKLKVMYDFSARSA
jgi:hypothetical protein